MKNLESPNMYERLRYLTEPLFSKPKKEIESVLTVLINNYYKNILYPKKVAKENALDFWNAVSDAAGVKLSNQDVNILTSNPVDMIGNPYVCLSIFSERFENSGKEEDEGLKKIIYEFKAKIR